jgi:DNA-binding XRE family transcriptional regulator
MTKVQGFKAPDGTEMVVLPRADYDALREAAEDVADAAAAARAEERLAAGEDELIPWEMSKRLSGGENPINVWRKYRGLTISGLAELAGISQPYLSEIEAGKREGTIKTLAALARALRLPLDDLAPVERAAVEPKPRGKTLASGRTARRRASS